MTTLVVATRNHHKAQEIQAILGAGFRCLTLDEFPGAPTVVEDAPTFEGNAAKKALALAEWLLGMRNAERGMRIDGTSFVLADDSGLEVDALGGKPGVHSARFAALDSPAAAAGNSPDAANNAKLVRLLRDVPEPKRAARFRCVLALVPLAPPHEPERRSPTRRVDDAGLEASRVGDRRSDLLAGSGVQSANLVSANSHPSPLTPHLFSGTCEGRITLYASGSGGFGYDPHFVPDGFAQSFAELGDDAKNRISHRARALHELRKWFDSAH
jgi:XTP/dITP diphosphohydrolase